MTNTEKLNFIDPQKAFEEAISSGILSDDETAQNFAGNFMYMHSIGGINYFKNIRSRKYGYDQETIMKTL